MNNIQIFNNPQFGEVRIVTSDNGEPMFCLADVCKALDLHSSKVAQRLTEDVLSKYPLETAGGTQQANFINEDGLYDTILDSRKPEAKKFRKWITSEVLPSVRKTGGYIVAKEDDTPEMIMARAVLVAKATIEKQSKLIEVQKAQIDNDKPKVIFHDAVVSSKTTCLIKELADILNQNGCPQIGQNRLFRWLRNHGYLCSSREYFNMPTQKAMDMKLFKVEKGTRIDRYTGGVITTRTTKVTTKGLDYFINKFLNK